MGKEIVNLSWDDVDQLAGKLAGVVVKSVSDRDLQWPIRLYGVPRGGLHVAAAIRSHLRHGFELVDLPGKAHYIVDDLIDTGATRDVYRVNYPNTPFLTLLENPSKWFVFPWERMQNEQGPEENIRRMLEFIGEDPKREGLIETPSRVVKSWKELFSGYNQDPTTILKTFTDGACDEMVILKGVEFYSHCEHHLLPFTGSASIGYIPNGRVVGISKLARLLEVFSRRLQIQERIGQQITSTLMEVLKPKGAGCILKASHSCMTCRGVNKQHSVMITSSLAGVFRNPAPRQEFLMMAGM